MAYELRKCCMVSTILVILFSSLRYWVEGEPQVPCFFIFGDSLVDNGNNNNLYTLAKSNYPPYGVDFPNGQATGRFTNGRTMADFTAELLGFRDYIPPFVDSSRANILLGINYASSGAGIRNETGQHLGERISLDKQLKNHQTIVSQINNIIGSNESTIKYLNKCLYYVGMGSNDYKNNYLMPQIYPTSQMYTPDQYATVLIQQYSEQIKNLYNNGARKVALYAIGPLGCTPSEIGTYGTNGSSCVDKINTLVEFFNTGLRSLVDELNDNLTDAKFIYVNLYDLTLEAIGDPSSFGFKVTNTACCDVGKKNSLPCLPLQIPCQKRSEYLFWDAFHPSEASYKIAAQRTYHAQSLSDAYPMDIYTLAQLQ